MKRIKLSVTDDYCTPDNGLSPIWRNSKRYDWEELYVYLNLPGYLVSRIRNWQNITVEAKTPFTPKEERIKCEIEGLSILLELRKELPNFKIEYQNIFGFYVVLNEEQEDDSY